MFTKWAAAVLVVSIGAVALADEVELVSGDVLNVTNVVSKDGRVRMDHPILGPLDVPATGVRAIRRDAAPQGSSALAAALSSLPAATGADAAAGAVPATEPKWKFKAEVGVTGTSGNTHTQDIHLAGGALYESPEHRWKFDAGYARGKTSHVTTKEQWFLEGLKDWMFGDSPWLFFATARYDNDKYQQWSDRLSVAVGPGYKLVDEEDLKVTLRGGIAATREWGTDDDRWRPEALVGGDVNWKINESQTLEGGTRYYRDLRDTNRYRVLSHVAWAIKLSQTEALSLKIGLEHEYDTHRRDPFKKEDVKYFAALLYEF